MMSVQERGMLKTATRCFDHNYVEPHLSSRVNQSHAQLFKLGNSLFSHLWNTVGLQVPSEEEYYQQEEFTHKRKPTSTVNKFFSFFYSRFLLIFFR